MKIRNTKDYRDRETLKMQKAGESREVTAKRGKEIIKAGCAEAVADTEKSVFGTAPESETKDD